MSWIVLAAGLGANCIVLALLFRRLRADLNRQLRDVRAERNSEWILHALQASPEPTEQQAMQAANGSGLEPEPRSGPQPVRRKKHLGLYIGGGLAALGVTLVQVAREAWQSHRGQLVAAAAATAAAATATVLLLAYAPWRDDDGRRPPSSAPTAGPAPSYTQPPPSAPTPSASPSPPGSASQPSESARPTPDGPTPGSPTATAPPVPTPDGPEPTATPSQPEETQPPGSNPPPARPEPEPTPPAEPPPGSPPAEEPTSTPVPSAPCAGLAVRVLIIEACLPLGGGG